MTLSSYATFRRSIFDPKGDMDPVTFVQPRDLARAAQVMGTVFGLTPLSGGTFHAAYRFDTPSGSYVIRVPKDERLAPGLLVEEWAAKAAADAKVKTVVPLLTDTSHYAVPFSYQILPFIEGNASDVRITQMHLFRHVHLDGYGPLDPRSLSSRPRGLFDTWQDYLTVRLDEHLDTCVRIGAMSDKEAEQTDDLIRALEVDVGPVLVHGDLSPRNIIGDTVIDWDGAIAGDSLWDTAAYFAFHADRQPVLLRDESWSTYWTYYLRIVIARTVHRHRFQIPENPVYPKASARIQMALGRLNG